mgnify:CR=1 FL=1
MDAGQAKFVYRHMAFLGAESTLAAEASECAAEQGQFFPYHDLIFQNQGPKNTGAYATDRLTSFAEQTSLDKSKFSACLTSHKYKGKVEQSTQEATAIGVQSTPTVLINGRLIQNPGDLTTMQNIIREELAKKP